MSNRNISEQVDLRRIAKSFHVNMPPVKATSLLISIAINDASISGDENKHSVGAGPLEFEVNNDLSIRQRSNTHQKGYTYGAGHLLYKDVSTLTLRDDG